MTHEEALLSIALILGLGMVAQWLAGQLRVPSILILLTTGFLAGAVTGVLDPDELFGHLLFPLISISVALVLYEGGLSLKLREIRGIGRAFMIIITGGALITWLLGSLGAHYILGLNWEISILLGAILVVSGPTVVTPLLLHVRPQGRTGAFLKWEGIFIDPVGAIIAVITVQAIAARDLQDGTIGLSMIGGVGLTFLVGGVIGVVASILLIVALKNYLVPDRFEAALSLAAVVGVFAVSNTVREESGLFAVTLMGLALANQRFAPIQRIVHFKENLWSIILGSLFIILGARLEYSHIEQIANYRSLLFLAFLILVARPLVTLMSTWRSRFSWNERAFIAWMMPRGIVAASVASIFELELTERGIDQAEMLVPYTFLVIIGTVGVYGFTAKPVAQRLGIAGGDPQGVLILGAHPFGQSIGMQLLEEGYRVLLADTNRRNIQGARLAGLPTYYGNILSEEALREMDLGGIGKFLALTPNDEVNAISTLSVSEAFDRSHIFQIAPHRLRGSSRQSGTPARHLQGRILAFDDATFEYFSDRLRNGASLKKTMLTKNYDFESFLEHYRESAVPIFRITSERVLQVFTSDRPLEPQPGDKIISLVDPIETSRRDALQISPDRVLTAEEMEEAGLTSSYCDWQASVERHGGTKQKPKPRPVNQ